MIFIIASAYNEIKQTDHFYWGGKYFPDIKKYLPVYLTDILSINTAILYFCKKEQKFRYSILLNITGIQVNNNFIKLNYSVAEQMQYKSYQIRNALKKYLKKDTVLELPFCAVVDETEFFTFIDNSSLEDKLSIYEQNNDWESIVKILEKYYPLEKSKLWNDENLLNRFAFATAKMAECTLNLKKFFPDKNKRKAFLEQKRKFRELTITLRSRCIELDQNKPAFYSNLAYTYYQSATELNTPGGRRDGNLNKEASSALFFFDKALELDQNRITDLYRKSNLLSDILFNNILYAANTNIEIKERYNQAYDSQILSIKTLETLIANYENNLDEYLRKRFFKYYVKAFYKLSSLNLQLGCTKINPLALLCNNNPLFKLDIENSEQKLSYLNNAIKHIKKCIELDRIKPQKNLVEAAAYNNFVAGVYKAYTAGKIYLYRFLLTKDLNDEKLAKDFLLKANETEFPKEQKKQNKIFILEKLATLYLIEEQPRTAVHLLENHYKKGKFFPEYAALTLAISYMLTNQKEAVLEIIEQYIKNEHNIMRDKFKKLYETIIARKKEDIIKLLYSTNIRQ